MSMFVYFGDGSEYYFDLAMKQKKEREESKKAVEDPHPLNFINNLPEELKQEIFIHVPRKDLPAIALINSDYGASVAMTQQILTYRAKTGLATKIETYKRAATELNTILSENHSGLMRIIGERKIPQSAGHESPYQPFHLDLNSWNMEIEGDNPLPFEAAAKECYFDLLEAICEYPSFIIEGLQKAATKKLAGTPVGKFCDGLLSEALRTAKGDVCLYDYEPLLGEFTASNLVPHSDPSSGAGPWIDPMIVNSECSNWCNYSYNRLEDWGRQDMSLCFHIHHFIGIKEGERIVIQLPSESEDAPQVILRCRQKRYRYENLGNFEEVLQNMMLGQVPSHPEWADPEKCRQAWKETQRKMGIEAPNSNDNNIN